MRLGVHLNEWLLAAGDLTVALGLVLIMWEVVYGSSAQSSCLGGGPARIDKAKALYTGGGAVAS